MHPSELHIKNFTYTLPDERIAKYPLEERDLSKLLICRHGTIVEDIYRHVDKYLPENSVLVFNNTRVIQARLFFRNVTGAKIEIFCLEPAEGNPDMVSVMSSKKSVRWNCMLGRAGKWKEKTLELRTGDLMLCAEIVERTSDAFVIEFTWAPEELTFAEVLDKAGMMPIPPYLRRESEEIDLSRYQTVYAKNEGSVAAPTAGLHFTDRVFDRLKGKNISREEVTLHVGAGTFKPVKSETMQGHDMHAEWMDVHIEVIERLVQLKGGEGVRRDTVAVGTTSLRTIESLYWMGVKAILNHDIALTDIEVKQWDVYDSAMSSLEPISAAEALKGLLQWMKRKNLERLIAKTQIMIAPPYRLRVADALLTNFHQPGSTLLLLVAAVVGPQWKQVYDYALKNNFRFLSYGDGCLLYPV